MYRCLKYCLGLWLLLLSTTVLPAQTSLNSVASDSTNIYRFVITEYVRGLKSKKQKRNSSTINIMGDPTITSNLPKTRRHYEIDYISTRDIKRKLRKGQNSVPVLKILPLEVRGSIFWVRLKAYDATLSREKLGMTEVFTTSFSFRYNCTSNSLEFMEQMTDYQN